MANTTTGEDVFALASRLSPAEKARLIARLADELAASSPSENRSSIIGVAADLGRAPSAEEIDEARREMLGG